MTEEKRINVTVLVGETEELDKVAKDLEDQGFVLNEALSEIGVLTGSVKATQLANLAMVSGVSAVEEERTDYHTQT